MSDVSHGTPAKPKKAGTKAKKPPRIYAEVREVIDVASGRRCYGLLAEDDVQRAAMKERGFKKGMRVALDVHAERCYSQWMQTHKLGQLLVANVDGFESLDAHKALKKVQQAGDIECEHEAFDIPGLGKVTRSVARSLAFDEMGQDVYDRVFKALCQYIGATYFGGLDDVAVAEMIDLMPVDPP